MYDRCRLERLDLQQIQRKRKTLFDPLKQPAAQGQ